MEFFRVAGESILARKQIVQQAVAQISSTDSSQVIKVNQLLLIEVFGGVKDDR
ncbi:hypothetical protein [Spartinivicinus poritis]|uniref:Uncharacterized protein n=1 Tax=Spartinivicinus poritis TaxID=2994640 RepID=A0ABT5UF26_9GAMM|nr:hypothetical protein [Spartinivicinus sp. A2-2]MDE1464912.1 hypothetical protein [Spartinivicinus sp. A2-2]